MMKKLLYKSASLVLILVCFFGQANAQFQEGIELTPVIMPTFGSNISNGATNVHNNTTTDPSKILNIITFKINESTNTFFASSFEASVSFDLELTDFSGTVTQISNKTLQVKYDNAIGAKYKVLDYITYKDYKNVKITFTGPITYSQAPVGWNPLTILEVNNEMRTTVFNNLSTNTTDLTPTFNAISQPTTDILNLAWSFPATAHENLTQLEWVYVEDEMIAFYSNDFNAMFQNNSTRIDLQYNEKGLDKNPLHASFYTYNIPMLYPQGGKLYYRTRAVQRKSNGTLIFGNWSTVSNTEGNFPFAGHEPNLNWQSSTSFAEGGKSKTVIQYFDGSLRGRQTVTKDNSTGNTVVGETIYDLQGRPNIQILPTPTSDNTIKFFNGFNKFNGMATNEDPAKYFDLTPSAVIACQGAMALDTSVGNGRYYSGNNDWLVGPNAEAKSKYIPNAQGFAFTETRFMDDATERVQAQGGVGADHQIGSGHETKYYYGKPAQQELDALFGTEVGYADHYSKNMVQDANGQRSVSYVDMHGRTIATALAGDPTDGIDPIINNQDYPLLTNATIKNDLLTPTSNVIQGNSIVSVSTFLAAANTACQFVYELTPAILQLSNCNNQPICFDCKYDLEISIRSEECNAPAPIVYKYNNLQIVSANQACNTPMGFIGGSLTAPATQININTSLAAGSYVITKTLTINDSMFQIRRDSAVKALLCRTKESLFNTIFDSLVQVTGCGATPSQTCDSCLANLGTFNIYKQKYLASISPATANDEFIHEQYTTDSLDCVQACSLADNCAENINPQLSTITNLRNQMLDDMKPFTGQYATDTITSVDSAPNFSSIDAKYNIFSNQYTGSFSQSAVGPKPFFKNPRSESNTPNNFYYDDNNIIDNSIHANATNSTLSILNTINPTNNYPFRPDNDLFSTLYQDSWANSLIKYHPEYNKLIFAETNMRASYNWADRVTATSCYQRALDSNFVNPIISDPYFALPGTQADKDSLTHYLYTGISYETTVPSPSIWQIANSTIACVAVDSIAKYACMMRNQHNEKLGMSTLITNPTEQNEVWDHFKTLYFSYRDEMVLRYIQNNTPGVISRAEINQLIAEGKDLIFANNQDIASQNGAGVLWAGITNPLSTDTTGLGVFVATNGLNNCEGQRPFWKARLKNCEAFQSLLALQTAADTATVNNIINTILDGMVQVCQNSVNAQQPYGSSTISPASTATPSSFETVINTVLAAHGIATPPTNYFCNPYTIEFPKPYGLNPTLFVNNSNVLDSCACKRFTSIKAEAIAAGYNAQSFVSMNQFLNSVYHDSLTLVVWNGLQQCGTLINTCCRIPLISSTQSLVQNGVNGIKIYYTLPTKCDLCKISVYSQFNNSLLFTFDNGICGTNSYFLNINNCLKYKFVISCKTSCGILTSDTTYYDGCPIYASCVAPKITKIENGINAVNSLQQSIYVQCQFSTSSTNCSISMYSNTTPSVLIHTISNLCGAAYAVFDVVDTCEVYKFKASSTFTTCGVKQSSFKSSLGCLGIERAIDFSDKITNTISFTKSTSSNSNALNTTSAITLKGGFECNTPVITAVNEINSSSLNIHFLLPTNCDNCTLFIYDEFGNQLEEVTEICNTTDYIFNNFTRCTKFSFKIICINENCGTLTSATFNYNGNCNNACPAPVITATIFNPNNNMLQVYYQLPPNCQNCSIARYDESGQLVENITDICGTYFTEFYIKECKQIYHFIVNCDYYKCDPESSLPVYFSCPKECDQPVINTIEYLESQSAFEVHYTLPTNCEKCSISMFNGEGGLVKTIDGICGTYFIRFAEYEKCKENYCFVITCESKRCGTLTSNPKYYDGCPKPCALPVIDTIVYLPNDGQLQVNFTLPSSCGECSITMYDINGNIVETQNGICGITGVHFSINDCTANYYFIISCNNEECGELISETKWYNGCCPRPVINSVFATNAYNFNINYQLPANCNNCTLIVLNPFNQVVQTINNICGTTYTNIIVMDTCVKYKFVINCESELCGVLVSDTATNIGCVLPCIKPTISSVTASGVNHSFQVFYQTTPNCDSCKLFMYDVNGVQVGYNGNICGTTTHTFTSPLYDSCAKYTFIVKCYSRGCDSKLLTSKTFTYNGCAATIPDSCLKYQPIYLAGYAVIPPFLSCGYVKPCISCEKIDALTTEFVSIYPSYAGVPFLENNSTQQHTDINNLWARFINYRVGFSKKAIDYAVAYRNCHPLTGPAPAPNSNALCAFEPPLNSTGVDTLPHPSPCEGAQTQAYFMAELQFNSIKDSLIAKFDSLYKAKCFAAQYNEKFYMNFTPKEYHYTLYYYDQAGNLVKTIPPAAVKPNFDAVYLASIANARVNNNDLPNPLINAVMATQYRYNSLNQVVEQKTPDAGISKFWYDRLGRLVVSQNAKQVGQSSYSYTQYDDLGRITSVGEKPQTQLMSQAISQNETSLATWLADITNGGSLKKQITRTVYDVGYFNANQPTLLQPVLTQTNLRNRVSYTQLINQEPADFATNEFAYVGAHATATYYSYDIHGNVDTLVQDYNEGYMKYKDPTIADPTALESPANASGNRFKKMVYDYDLISGKVNKVSYQPSFTDQFYHKYGYDAENRITKVETSHDSIYWEQDAAYEYYRHGPLSRTVLGQNQVQGLDYAYTIQGWLKGVNSTAISSPVGGGQVGASFDMGNDGQNPLTGGRVARDAYSYSLNYFNGDYKPIGYSTTAFATPFASITNNLPAAADGVQLGKDLFNGNIRAMMVNIPSLTTGGALLYGYRYDQLNRIKAMNSFTGFNNTTNNFGTTNIPTISDNYKERITYDPNGNIKTYLRNGTTQGGTPLAMDNLTYGYNNTAGNLQNNKLRHVKDAIADANYTEDIDNQPDDNYTYDAIGNLIGDVKEGITNINWNIYGKISSIAKTAVGTSPSSTITYTYDASGNRISKTVVGGTSPKTTYYVRDASGNVMSIYCKDQAINLNELTQTEVSLYGSSRLGVWNINRSVANIAPVNYSAFNSTFVRANKIFELSNHLGNVLVTISDKKLAVDSENDGIINYYNADVVTANDYYPFGMTMPSRKYSAGGGYRYGFNGKEKASEITSDDYDFGARIYDGRLGKFLSTDPRKSEYAWQSPYAYHRNSPILYIDFEGKGDPPYVKNNVNFVPLFDPIVWVTARQDGQTFTKAALTNANWSGIQYTVNTQQYTVNGFTANAKYGNGSNVPMDDITPIGQTVSNGAVVSGRSSPQSFYIAQSESCGWSCGQGDVPANTRIGFGGGIPVLVDGLAYGDNNAYSAGAPAGLPTTGDPGTANQKYLTQRSNKGYSLQNNKTVGKSIVAFNSKTNDFLLIVQQDGVQGMTMDEIRDYIISKGFNNAVSFDGSTSATLVSDNNVTVTPSGRKNNSIPTGATFTGGSKPAAASTPKPTKKKKG